MVKPLVAGGFLLEGQLAADQKVTLTFTLSDQSTQDVDITVYSGKDGVDGMMDLKRETKLLKFDLNQPDADGPNAAGRISDGCYVRMRDYLDGVTSTAVHVEYHLLDVPMRSSSGNCCSYSFNALPPMIEASTGRVYCDVQLTTYYTFPYNRAIGSKTNRRCYRPSGSSGVSSVIPTSSKSSDWECFRFYRTIIR